MSMSLKKFIRSTTIVLAALAGAAVHARATDRVIVELPFHVTVGEQVLEPGKYTISRLPNSGAPILLIHKDGQEFKAMTMAIPAYSLQTPEHTKVVLHRVGDHEYHFDKIWIQGSNSGYEIPLPRNARERQAEWRLAESLAGPSISQEAAGKLEPEEMPLGEPEVSESRRDAAPPQAVVPERTTEPERIAFAAPPPDSGTFSATTVNPVEMPKTSANWLPMLLLGGVIPGGGLWVFRRRRTAPITMVQDGPVLGEVTSNSGSHA